VKLFDRLRALLQLDDPPWRIAAARALGVIRRRRACARHPASSRRAA